MASINMESIIAKAKAFAATDEFQSRADNKIDAIVLTGASIPGMRVTIAGAAEAADKFIEVLKSEVNSLGIGGDTAVAAASSLSRSAPVKIGKNKYQIEVSFDGDLTRPSLNPQKYDNVNNIVALLNNGYDAGGIVFGIWHGEEIASLQHRTGTHFIQSAVNSFMANYAQLYGVKDISVDPIYQ